jgi:uncharacterized protein (TIGR02466 family)
MLTSTFTIQAYVPKKSDSTTNIGKSIKTLIEHSNWILMNKTESAQTIISKLLSLALIVTLIDSAVNRYFVHCGFSHVDLAQLLPGQVWLNDLAAGRHILPHTHGVSTVGWTYYLDVDHDSGAIVFLDPKGNTAWDYFQHPPRPGVGTQHQYCQRFSPVRGQLIIFPGWLTHYVEPGNGLRRLSLSGEHYPREFLTRVLIP